eukprot:4797252-Amphidinium_carterae.1
MEHWSEIFKMTSIALWEGLDLCWKTIYPCGGVCRSLMSRKLCSFCLPLAFRVRLAWPSSTAHYLHSIALMLQLEMQACHGATRSALPSCQLPVGNTGTRTCQGDSISPHQRAHVTKQQEGRQKHDRLQLDCLCSPSSANWPSLHAKTPITARKQ